MWSFRKEVHKITRKVKSIVIKTPCFTFEGFNNLVTSLLIQPDKKILFGGRFTQYGADTSNSVSRLGADGSLDTTFDFGTAVGPVGATVGKLYLRDDGKIIVIGDFTEYDSNPRTYLVRINSDGSFDNTLSNIAFNTGGFIRDVLILPNNSMILVGSFITVDGQSLNRIVKITDSGTIDTSFLTGTGFNSYVQTIFLNSDGKYLVAGSFVSYNGDTSKISITKLNIDGTPDTTFNAGTGITGNSTKYIKNIIEQSDGKLVCTGDFNVFAGQNNFNIVRLNSNGSLDNTFNSGSGFDSYVEDMAQQPNGKLIIAGAFQNYNGASANYIIRLNENGDRDTSFSPPSSINGFITAIDLQEDGKVVCVGNFTTPNERVLRLNSDGSLDNCTAIPPTTTITGQGATANPGTQNFAITATDTDGTISSWYIDWGDGSISEGLGDPPTPQSHEYTTLGERTAVITVTDNDGLTGTDSFTTTIEPRNTGFTVEGRTFVGCDAVPISGTLTVASGTVTVFNNFEDISGTPSGANLEIGGQEVTPNSSIVLGVGTYTYSLNTPFCSQGTGYSEIIFT